jgi:hypothetical protein
MYFTVKCVGPDGTHQFFQTAEVIATPSDKVSPPQAATVSFHYGPRNDYVEMHEGEIFVMNDQGKTVERYRLAAGFARDGDTVTTAPGVPAERTKAA